jgi:hypothetical protein
MLTPFISFIIFYYFLLSFVILARGLSASQLGQGGRGWVSQRAKAVDRKKQKPHSKQGF